MRHARWLTLPLPFLRSTVRVWSFDGVELYKLEGHTSFVYSLAVTSRGDIISGGEDRAVRIWRGRSFHSLVMSTNILRFPCDLDGECVQTIVHPAISVWSVSTMPNSDIVTGCSDGVIRVFSRDEDRWAPTEEVTNFELDVAAQAVPADVIGGVKISSLPGPDALMKAGMSYDPPDHSTTQLTPKFVTGTKSGENLLINNKGKGEVYSVRCIYAVESLCLTMYSLSSGMPSSDSGSKLEISPKDLVLVEKCTSRARITTTSLMLTSKRANLL